MTDQLPAAPPLRVYLPNEEIQKVVRPLGYVALAYKPLHRSGLMGGGTVILAVNVKTGYPVGPWTTWLLGGGDDTPGSGLYLGHYFDVEENAWADFWKREV